MELKNGYKSGMVTVKKVTSKRNNKGYLLCECVCDCGKELMVPNYRFTTGGNKIYSCGCVDRRKTSGGKYKHPLYRIYKDVKNRCYYQSDISYKYYGGRGIKMCNEWKYNFMVFYDWAIKNGWRKGLSLDRIDVNKNYEPDNCRWVDYVVQNNNRRNNHRLTYNNETHTVAEWSKILNIKHSTILERLKRGWSVEETLSISTEGHYKKI